MDCILNVYKEAGWTSFDVTKRLRAILHEKKIGHTGTLDPMAEGVLVVCAGGATKLANAITGTEKLYEARLRLGVETDTEDISGRVLRETEVHVSPEAFQAAVCAMVGTYGQIPPMYSAKKQGGRKLYELARQGKVVERKPVTITVHEITVDQFFSPEARLTIRCSKGTYIRSICAEIGRRLQCGAVMTGLRRLRVGRFSVEESHRISEIEALAQEGRLWDIAFPPMYVAAPSVLCFGKFDGGHRGHQLVFENVFRIAEERKLETVLLTFSQNPDNLLKGARKPGISTAPEHLTRLRALGFDHVFSFPMTAETMRIPAEDFLRRVLVEALHAKAIVAGTDCSFGYKAAGNAEMLLRLSEKYGYTAHILKKREVLDAEGNSQEISSTLIKAEIAAGNVHRAKELLGRYFSISGIVSHGRHLGGPTLSFPTANLLPPEGKSIPKPGVYATRVLVGQKLYMGMSNVGDNPTVSEGNPLVIETHILDFSGDLYGQRIRVEFVDRIRDQARFPSMEALREQLMKDRERVREILEHQL